MLIKQQGYTAALRQFKFEKEADALPGLRVQGGYRTYDPKRVAELEKIHGREHVQKMLHAPIGSIPRQS
jgi:hypothetical protein